MGSVGTLTSRSVPRCVRRVRTRLMLGRVWRRAFQRPGRRVSVVVLMVLLMRYVRSRRSMGMTGRPLLISSIVRILHRNIPVYGPCSHARPVNGIALGRRHGRRMCCIRARPAVHLSLVRWARGRGSARGRVRRPLLVHTSASHDLPQQPGLINRCACSGPRDEPQLWRSRRVGPCCIASTLPVPVRAEAEPRIPCFLLVSYSINRR